MGARGTLAVKVLLVRALASYPSIADEKQVQRSLKQFLRACVSHRNWGWCRQTVPHQMWDEEAELAVSAAAPLIY